MIAEGPILFQGFLGFGAVGDDAFLVALAADAEDALFLVDVDKIEAGEFADAEASGVEKFEKGAIAAEEEAFVLKFDRPSSSGGCGSARAFFGERAAGAGGGRRTHFGKLIEEAVHFFGGKDGGDAFRKLGSGD